jgi:hypothetical protein
MADSRKVMRRSALAVLVPVLAASCVAPPADAPPPRPATPMTVAPPPAAVAPPAPVQPGAVEAGTWSYARTNIGSSARFGPAPGSVALSFDCAPAEGTVTVRMLRINPSAPATTATLRASTTAKAVTVMAGGAFGAARVTARDPILDALAFSRGRFGVAIDGRERWYPAWPEIARVVEDCRA